MKKIISVLFIMSFSIMMVFSQSEKSEPIQEPTVPYRLFKTNNNWTFIQLDTVTGKMWQIQYDTKGDNRGGCVLNDRNLAKDKEEVVGRFTLYPTENMWTFILLDQIEGNTWQVQWAFEEKERFVIPIY
ncbi:MAG: hypothetical protein J6J00_05190 [Treponema sp.]|nr:hypothetical protein [Treponema sp.]